MIQFVTFYVASISVIVAAILFAPSKEPESICAINAPMEQAQCRALFFDHVVEMKGIIK